MIRQPPKVGAIQFHHEPESTNTSSADVTTTTFQGTHHLSYSISTRRCKIPLTKVFSNPESFKSDFNSELLLLQELLNENPRYRSFSWQVLRKASRAKTYIGDGSHDPSLLSQCTKRSEDYVRGAR